LAAIDGLPAERRGGPRRRFHRASDGRRSITAIANHRAPATRLICMSAPRVIWVVNVYQIALWQRCCHLEHLAKSVGHRRVYLAASSVPVASLAARAPGSLAPWLTARVLQGLGASGINECEYGAGSFRYPGTPAGPVWVSDNTAGGATLSRLAPNHRPRVFSRSGPELVFASTSFGLVAILDRLKTLPQPASDACFDFHRRAVGSGMFSFLAFSSLGSECGSHAQAGLV